MSITNFHCLFACCLLARINPFGYSSLYAILLCCVCTLVFIVCVVTKRVSMVFPVDFVHIFIVFKYI